MLCGDKHITDKYNTKEYQDNFRKKNENHKKYNRSLGEKNLHTFIEDNFKGEVEHSKWINNVVVDTFLPSLNIAIEYNGLNIHSEFRSYVFNNKTVREMREYHKNKTDRTHEVGVRMIHVWEDSWSYNREVTQKWLLTLIGAVDREVVYGRKTSVRFIDKEDSRQLMDNNHIQGGSSCSFAVGLFYKEKLISSMEFKKVTVNETSEEWNLVRYVVEYGYSVVGGFSKLLKFFCNFVDSSKELTITSFADLSWVDRENNVYLRNGFTPVKTLKPDYKYIYKNRLWHKFGFRLNKLKKILKNFDGNKTEYQNCIDHKIYRLWDSGKIKYQFIRT
jgi:hypothetical protein